MLLHSHTIGLPTIGIGGAINWLLSPSEWASSYYNLPFSDMLLIGVAALALILLLSLIVTVIYRNRHHRHHHRHRRRHHRSPGVEK